MVEQRRALLLAERRRRPASPGSSVASRAAPLISRLAPLSARMWPTCIRFSSGLTGTWTRPARAQASGSRLVSRFLGSQDATRSPCASPLACKRRRQRADRRFQPGIVERALARHQRRRGGIAEQGQMVERARAWDRAFATSFLLKGGHDRAGAKGHKA